MLNKKEKKNNPQKTSKIEPLPLGFLESRVEERSLGRVGETTGKEMIESECSPLGKEKMGRH